MKKLFAVFVVALTLASVAAVGKGWKWGATIVKNGAPNQSMPYDGWTWDAARATDSE
jgi:hypothetical protein